MLDRPLHHLIDLLRFANVELYGERVDARRLQGRPPLLEVFGLPTRDGDSRAERTEFPSDGEADAGAAAGNDRDAVLQEGFVEHADLIIDVKIAACRAHASPCACSCWGGWSASPPAPSLPPQLLR